MSTRICVKNIPKHLTEERFKNHFSSRGEVTDVKILRTKDGRSRQFGFIGYKTVAEAKAALHYFNHTYLDTSKILVESAQPVGDEKLSRPWSKYSSGSSAHNKYEEMVKDRKEKKRKVGDITEDANEQAKEKKKFDFVESISEQASNDPQLHKFLEVMKPRTAKKIWENDGLTVPGEDNPSKKAKVALVTTRGVQSKKPGGAGVILEKTHVKFVDSDASDDELYEDLPASATADDDNDVIPVNTNTLAHNPNVSDLDYLKSKMKKETQDEEEDEEEDEEKEEENSKKKNVIVKKEKNENDMDIEETKKEDIKEEEVEENSPEKEEEKKEDEIPEDSGRLFLRNLSYSTTEDDIVNLCKTYGEISEVHIPIHPTTKAPRGIAFVLFLVPENAARAMSALDGTIFQGRLLHVLPAKVNDMAKAAATVDPNQSKEKSFKQKKEQERKANSEKSHNWNTLFMNSDAVAESIAARLGVSKGDILDRESNDSMAVRLALAETQIINETKKMLEQEGVNLDTLGLQNDKSVKRSKTVIVVKNIPFSTDLEELKELFSQHGTLGRVILPPARTIALIEFLQINEAKKAFRDLAYKKFKHVPLYLEWAPSQVFVAPPNRGEVAETPEAAVAPAAKSTTTTATTTTTTATPAAKSATVKPTAEKTQAAAVVKESMLEDTDADAAETSSIFVKNLNFATTDQTLREHFSKAGQIRSVTIAKKKDMKNPGATLSMGYGFVEFAKKEDAVKALKTLQGGELEGHALVLKFSNRDGTRNDNSKGKQRGGKPGLSSTKLLVKNVAFETTKEELRDLFRPFGQIKSIRIPKKFDGKSRGFAFVEFLTKQEAANAKDALQNSHFYGRHLVLEYASEDTADVNTIIEKTSTKFSRQQ